MPLDPQQEQALLQQSVAALQRGRAVEARAQLEQLTAGGSSNPVAYLLLAIALRALGEASAEEQALDRLLQLDPRSIRGLIMKGDCRAAAGDVPAASQYYRTALAIGDMGQVPPDAIPEVERARTALRALDHDAHANRERPMTR